MYWLTVSLVLSANGMADTVGDEQVEPEPASGEAGETDCGEH